MIFAFFRDEEKESELSLKRLSNERLGFREHSARAYWEV
jgi:hypothetical protein